ncbi:MAG: amidohydrolase family protein [Ilumatobacteraceae bacterium]
MKVEEMVLVSIDDHVIEPPDMFDRHMPERYRGQAPRIVRTEAGVDQWEFLGTKTGSVGLNAVATWPHSEWSFDPVGFAEMRPGAYDLHSRIRDMDVNGVLASMCFPTFAGFAGSHLAGFGQHEPELTNVVVSAYNDWHIDEWCGTYPGRMIPMCIGSTWSPDALVAEINRVAKKGCKAITMPETPYGIGLPSFYTEYWDPIFTALCDNDMAACMHIGGAFNLLQSPPEAGADHLIMLAPQLSALTANDLIVGGVFKRFPDLRVALSEGGIGWIPFYLDRLDRHIENQSWTGLEIDGSARTPTEIFREHFLACFVTDPSALRLIDRIGEDIVAWECDYPHSDSSWPRSPEMLWDECAGAGLSDAQVHKISWENACRFFRHDPFEHIPRQQATVAALRSTATDVDTSETSKAEYRRRFEAALA